MSLLSPLSSRCLPRGETMSSAPWSSTILHKTQTPVISSLLPTSFLPFPTSRNIRVPHLTPTFIVKPLKFSSQPSYGAFSQEQPEEDEEPVIGDCLVYEEGIFIDPILESTRNFKDDDAQVRKPNNKDANVSPENLIPEGWLDIQRELNITKKERRRMAQQLEYGSKVEKRRQALRPLNSEEYEKFKNEKLQRLKPLVLDKPKQEFLEENDKYEKRDDERSGEGNRGRVGPRNPRLAVYGGCLEDISAFFSSGKYDNGAAEKSQGIFAAFHCSVLS